MKQQSVSATVDMSSILQSVAALNHNGRQMDCSMSFHCFNGYHDPALNTDPIYLNSKPTFSKSHKEKLLRVYLLHTGVLTYFDKL